MRSDRFPRLFASLAVAAWLLVAAASLQAQPAASPTGAPQFAPGVLTTIDPDVDRSDAISLHDIPEIRADESLKWKPSKWLKWESATTNPTNRTLFEMAEDAPYIHHVYCLEFTFKPLRMIEVDIPQPSGRLQRKNVWYMVYRVRNTGVGLLPSLEADGELVTTKQGVEPVRFLPQLVLVSQDRDAQGQRIRKAYLDRIIPSAMGPIERREMGGRTLLNSVEMTQRQLNIEAGRSQQGAWGVAIWEDVDPAMDFFSVFVGGLSNGVRWTDPPGAYQTGDNPGTGRKFTSKTLQLNFWRPGDQFEENEREIRFGAAPGRANLYDVTEGVAYRWLYR
jgi:hypothetical protein